MSKPASPNNAERESVGLLQTTVSVLAAAFGLSSSHTREREFNHGEAIITLYSSAPANFNRSLGIVYRFTPSSQCSGNSSGREANRSESRR